MVQQLLEELRVTKATNARRITELKKELATVRSVMIHYVNQIDSLNAENKVLKNENVEVKRRYNEVTQVAEKLTKEKETLNEVVTRASKLDVVNFSVSTLNSKGRKTTWFHSWLIFSLIIQWLKILLQNPVAKPCICVSQNQMAMC